ncbi:MAG: sulfatase [Planctomycetota bacterium]|nr:sulfatase [Planctomycetota bacterium]
MNRILSLILLLLLSSSQAFAEKKPNVLFLAVDDMNDWIGCLETTPRAFTPNLDQLAARGVNFTNAHTAGVFCAPSRAAIFSGQCASTTGCYRTANYFVDHPKIEPLQVSFAKAGYKTFGAGKLFHHPAGAIDVRGWNEFFLRNKSQREGGWPLDSWSKGTPFPSTFPSSIYNQGQEITGGLFLEWGAIPNSRENEMADTIRINWAVEKLKEEHDKPFFLGVGIYAPHFPNYCPQKYFDLYDPDKIELPPYLADDLDDLPPKIKKIKTARSRIHTKLEGLNAVDDAIHGYLACISYADAMMGRVLDALAASPYADNTIVVLWSDHGYHHGEKGDWGKHTLWERTSNVPFIWAGPGVAKGQKSDVTVSLIDMYPTLIDLCGLPATHQDLEGESLAKTLGDPTSARDRNVFLPHMNPGEYAVINRDWRYIRYGEDGEELYDLQADPNEWHNLAAKPEHAARKIELQKFAPATFAEPARNLNARKDLVVDGETFRWEKGEGNYTPASKNRPYPQAPATKSKVKKKKNILFIVCDDLNTHVSSSGYEPIHTPTLAQFASEGMTFRRAYCQYPVCGPSRASFLSGLYPQSTGILNNTADIRKERPGTISMPQFFKKNGYWTASVGKVFHSPRHEHGEVAWNEFVRFDNDELPVVRLAREKFEAKNGSVEKGSNRKEWKTLKKQVAAKLDAQTPPGYGRSGLTDEQHKDGKNARQVAKWLAGQAHGEKPFFIACGIQKPHVPFLAPDKYFDLYPTNKITFKRDRPELWDSLPASAMSKRYTAFGFELGKENEALRREYMQAYHACVSFIDAQIKIVLDALKKSGQWEDTVVIITSDHGYHLGDHFLWGKVTLFDIGAKVPFMIRAPGLTKPGTTSEAMVELIDIYPTVVNLAGLTAPGHLQGVSLRPLLGHPERSGKKKYAYSVVSRGQQLGYALRTQRWRYGKWPDGEELYNLTNDPQEKRNLAGKSHVAEQLKKLRELLSEKQKEAASHR